MPDDVQDQDVLQDILRDLIECVGEKNDRFGFEMDDDARVWRVYARAAQKRDSERLTQWNSSLDTLLIFAGLFSAVSTTFIIDSYKQMQPDYTELMFRALVANTSGKEFVQQPFRVTESSRAVNCLWISSLITSLSTALIAILAKQWIAAYPVPIRDNLREWAQLRQFRMDSMELWRLPELIAVIPVLLHVSLLLFLTGLVVFLLDIDTGTMVLALFLSTVTFGLYAFTTISPVLWNTSPFRTLLTPVLVRYVIWGADHRLVQVVVLLNHRLYGSRGLYVLRMTYGLLDLSLALFCRGLSAIARAVMRCARSLLVGAVPMVDRMLLPRHATTPSSLNTHRISETSLYKHDPWNTASTLSQPISAKALSWLAETAETTAVYNATLDALGDSNRGPVISPYLSTSLKARIRAEIPIAARAYRHEEQARYLRVAFHFGHDNMAVPLVNCVERWMYHDSGIRKRYADTIVRAYVLDTSSLGLETAFSEVAFDHWAPFCRTYPVLASTAHLVIRWFTDNWASRFRYFGIEVSYYPRLLVLVNAWRSHFEEDPSSIVALLDCIFSHPPGRIVPHYHEAHCAGDPRYCRLIDQIAATLEQYQFTTGRGDDVERTLKMQTFETFMFFWKLHGQHGYSEDAAHPSVHIWLSNEDALSGISIHGEHVLPLLYSIRPRSLPTRAHFALLFRLLDPTHTWHSPVSDDPLQPHALDQCLYLVDHFVFGGSENRRLALSLIDSGRLEPLSRAPSWNTKCLFLNLTETLATMATTAVNGDLTLMIPSEAPNDRALLVDKLVSSFIHADAECGPTGEIVRSWDLVDVASDYILHLASPGADSFSPWYLRRLCAALRSLQIYCPDRPCWEQISTRVSDWYNLPDGHGPSRRPSGRTDIAFTLSRFAADVGRAVVSAEHTSQDAVLETEQALTANS